MGYLPTVAFNMCANKIEDWYRIIALVSLPQTAFTATGAGVKSSVLFLRKYSAAQTEAHKQQKLSLQNGLLNQHNYKTSVEQLEREKLTTIKNATGAVYSGNLTQYKTTEDYKTWKSEISSDYTEKINALKEQLEEAYALAKQNKLPDYPIFMAIAEDIGYDATGKKTGTNKLDVIGAELARFIVGVNNGGV